MAKPGKKGVPRWIDAARYSGQGLKAAWKNESAFREECLLLLIAVPAAILLTDVWIERALLVGAVLLLMVVELLNSAIEAVVDRVSDDHHELSGRAKDMGSAAVLLTMLIGIIIWLSVLLF